MSHASRGEPRWRLWLLSLVVPVAFGVVGVAVRDSVPETWDEQFDQDIGRFYYHAWRDGGVAALEARFIPLQRHYGPAFAVVVVALHELLHRRLGWVENPVASHHMATLGVTCLMLWVVFWLGRWMWGTGGGLIAALILALLPQLVAHSQNNLKDTPLGAVFTVAVGAHVLALRRPSLGLPALAWAVVGGMAVGYGFAIKPNALSAWVVVAIWVLATSRLNWPTVGRGAVLGGVSAVTAILTVPLVWPYFRSQPLRRLLDTLATFREHIYNEYVFYLGEHIRAHDVPWHFPFVMLGVYTPVLVLLLLAGALWLALRAVRRGEAAADHWVLLWAWLLVPLLVQILSGAPKLDGLRHYLAVLPAVALLAAGTAVALWRWLSARAPVGRWFAAAAGVLWLAAMVRLNVTYHPYQNVFFNALTGGTAGAQHRFELDYWGVSLAAAARWLDTHAPAPSRVWLTIPGQHFFRLNRSRFHFVTGPAGRPHYKVNLLRGLLKTFDSEGDWRRPARAPVFAVQVAGADLLHIFAYPEHRDVPPGTPLGPAHAPWGGASPGWWAQETHGGAASGHTFLLPRLELDCAGNLFTGRAAGFVAEGYLAVPTAGEYVVEIFSDDDAALFAGEQAVVSSATLATTRNRVRLEAGWYPLRLEYRNDVGPACLQVRWGRVGEELEVLGGPFLWHRAEKP